MVQNTHVVHAHQSIPSLVSARLSPACPALLRGSMVIVMLWFGLLKFTAYEAEAIQGLVSNSPIVSWLNGVLSATGISHAIGLIEVAAGLSIASGFLWPRLGVLGGVLATCTFVVTLSFFVSTPGVREAGAGGFPVISVLPGQFLLKDLVLLAVSLWLLADSLKRWQD